MQPERDGQHDDFRFEHPRGTLAIILVYAALFILGWVVLYFFEFLPRGT